MNRGKAVVVKGVPREIPFGVKIGGREGVRKSPAGLADLLLTKIELVQETQHS